MGDIPLFERFYLAGGTALALRLGHRCSVDLDLFSTQDRLESGTRQSVLEAFQFFHPLILENSYGELLLRVGELQVGFFSYSFSLVQPPELVEDVAVASILDIGLMKLDALAGRGSRKDFYDVYFILQQMTLPELFQHGRIKYPEARDFDLMAVEAMVLFDNADRDLQPVMLRDMPWPDVKDFFVKQAKALGQRWFNGLDG
ncbi:MAG: nucleotidyl transferase AbiEii/AbiGii toxin family protein [Anaerolineales bacterium]|nr:nucleotidyl transferase AbiEii/AbiGii toxin family protein [Anaerolineales bacterium]